MSICYDGGMMVGCLGLPPEPEDWQSKVVLDDGEELDEDEDWRDFLTENCGMERYSKRFDADDENCYFGFPVEDCLVDNIDKWVVMIKKCASEFERITGEKAYIIGSQDIY